MREGDGQRGARNETIGEQHGEKLGRRSQPARRTEREGWGRSGVTERQRAREKGRVGKKRDCKWLQAPHPLPPGLSSLIHEELELPSREVWASRLELNNAFHVPELFHLSLCKLGLQSEVRLQPGGCEVGCRCCCWRQGCDWPARPPGQNKGLSLLPLPHTFSEGLILIYNWNSVPDRVHINLKCLLLSINC